MIHIIIQGLQIIIGFGLAYLATEPFYLLNSNNHIAAAGLIYAGLNTLN